MSTPEQRLDTITYALDQLVDSLQGEPAPMTPAQEEWYAMVLALVRDGLGLPPASAPAAGPAPSSA